MALQERVQFEQAGVQRTGPAEVLPGRLDDQTAGRFPIQHYRQSQRRSGCTTGK